MAKQIAKNQVEMVYDRPCDLESALKVTNYWIRVNRKQPVGIGTVGEDGKLTAGNSLQPQNTAVAPADQSKMRFILTFSKQAAPGVIHEVLPCFVSQDGHSGYRGENWDQTSENQFTGR
ncbi:hypothetical protein GKZ89_20585 [Bacillus mangrovi]|uniref:Uncharacterized protein n=2 Tax=Metabacillus mangrovi TaxID=1491830 RepID=A0A7X2S9L9_9BACI|nr:hypothetical protein [Metabacillus mangrovi]